MPLDGIDTYGAIWHQTAGRRQPDTKTKVRQMYPFILVFRKCVYVDEDDVMFVLATTWSILTTEIQHRFVSYFVYGSAVFAQFSHQSYTKMRSTHVSVWTWSLSVRRNIIGSHIPTRSILQNTHRREGLSGKEVLLVRDALNGELIVQPHAVRDRVRRVRFLTARCEVRN